MKIRPRVAAVITEMWSSNSKVSIVCTSMSTRPGFNAKVSIVELCCYFPLGVYRHAHTQPGRNLGHSRQTTGVFDYFFPLNATSLNIGIQFATS
jgi:hypothetical protein